MKIKELLTEKGFVEGVDYTLNGNNLVLIEKQRTVPGNPEVKDEQGNVITPATPDYIENYLEVIPSVYELMCECLKRVDYMAIINIYLDGRFLNGDINIELFLSHGDGWRATNIMPPAIEWMYNMIDVVADMEKQRAINAEVENYLAQTDKWAIREFETGKPQPPGVKEKRAEMRGKYVKI